MTPPAEALHPVHEGTHTELGLVAVQTAVGAGLAGSGLCEETPCVCDRPLEPRVLQLAKGLESLAQSTDIGRVGSDREFDYLSLGMALIVVEAKSPAARTEGPDLRHLDVEVIDPALRRGLRAQDALQGVPQVASFDIHSWFTELRTGDFVCTIDPFDWFPSVYSP